jgi:hypothetical protein
MQVTAHLVPTHVSISSAVKNVVMSTGTESSKNRVPNVLHLLPNIEYCMAYGLTLIFRLYTLLDVYLFSNHNIWFYYNYNNLYSTR